MNKISLHWKILLGMGLGILFALVMLQFSFGKTLVVDWVKPFGNMFINALKLIAIPLIFASLVKGVADIKDISKLSKMGVKTISMYLISTLLAVTIGVFMVTLIKPGESIEQTTRQELLNNYTAEAESKIDAANQQKDKGPLNALETIVSDNLFNAASDNRNMLQVIFFAIFFGIALVLIPEGKSRPVRDFFSSFNEVILKMIDLIMLAAPYGVFALLAALIVEAPNWDLFVALGQYGATVLLGLLFMLVLYAMVLLIVVKVPPKKLFKGLSSAQLLAFSTSSSAATLPVTKECVEKNFLVEEEVSSFVLPIGATINMDGTSLYQSVAAIFIAQAFGIDLTFYDQIAIIATATLASIGSAAVPGAGMVMLVIVLAQAGIPEAGLALIFAIDRPLDMCRTTINVTGDATISMLVAKSENKLGNK